MDRKRTEAFLEAVHSFQFTDILAFGKILEVEEKENLEDFVGDILVEFNKKDRAARRKLLKLAKDVAKENRENKKLLEKEQKEVLED